MADDRYSPVRREAGALVRQTTTRAATIGGLLAVLWGIELTDLIVFGGALHSWGIVPRTLWGLVGVAFAPFLHAGLCHLAANTLPFAVLGWLASGRRIMDFWVVSVVSALTAGAGVWLLGGAHTVHLGASSVIFGYLGFLMTRGLFERKLGSIFLSLGVTAVFGSMLLGFLPVPGISWLGHLFGFVGGVATAAVLGAALRGKERKK